MKKIEYDLQRQLAQVKAQGAVETVKNANVANSKQAELEL